MLFMIVERFRGGSPDAVGLRFRTRGRLIPDGSPLTYVASWMAADGSACYQVMESPDLAHLEPWLQAWRDLVDFEVVPVQTSAEFWGARRAPESV